MSERVTIKDAAKELGMSEQGVREHMKRNLFEIPIGYVTNLNNRNQYHIYRNMLDKHLGKETAASKNNEAASAEMLKLFLKAAINLYGDRINEKAGLLEQEIGEIKIND